jgi:hypothetical protein
MGKPVLLPWNDYPVIAPMGYPRIQTWWRSYKSQGVTLHVSFETTKYRSKVDVLGRQSDRLRLRGLEQGGAEKLDTVQQRAI